MKEMNQFKIVVKKEIKQLMKIIVGHLGIDFLALVMLSASSQSKVGNIISFRGCWIKTRNSEINKTLIIW